MCVVTFTVEADSLLESVRWESLSPIPTCVPTDWSTRYAQDLHFDHIILTARSRRQEGDQMVQPGTDPGCIFPTRGLNHLRSPLKASRMNNLWSWSTDAQSSRLASSSFVALAVALSVPRYFVLSILSNFVQLLNISICEGFRSDPTTDHWGLGPPTFLRK